MVEMFLQRMTIGPFSVNAYLLGCCKSKTMAVIDPGGEPDEIWQRIQKLGYSLKFIINTHGHLDHTAGNYRLQQLSKARILAHPDDIYLMTTEDNFVSLFFSEIDLSPKPDILINDGQVIEVGHLNLEVIHTPGHTQGGVCLLVEDILFTGDTLFAGSIGRTDLPGGNYQQIIASIQQKLYTLDDHLRILPGHGQESILGTEKRSNPFVKRPSCS